MKLTQASAYSEIKRLADVTDGPVLPHPYSSTEKKFRLERVSVTYVLRNGEWKFEGATAVGTVLKKDGTASKNTFADRVPYGWERDPQWAFLGAVIDAMRPTGSADLPAGPFTITDPTS